MHIANYKMCAVSKEGSFMQECVQLYNKQTYSYVHV